MKKVKTLALLLALCLLMSFFAGCGNDDTTQPDDTSSNGSQQSSADANGGGADGDAAGNLDEVRERVFYSSCGGSINGSLYLGMNAFAEKLAELSGGKMTIDLLCDSSYNEKQALDDLLTDNIDFVYLASGSASATVQDVAYLGMLDCYRYAETGDVTTLFEFADFLRDDMVSIYENYNARFLSFRSGANHTICTGDGIQIVAPEDVQGVILRCSSLMTTYTELMGGSAATVALAEVATAIQRGTVDGAWMPVEQAVNTGIYEVSTNITIFPVCEGIGSLICCKSTWDSLNDAEKAIVQEAADYFTEFTLNQWWELYETNTQKFEDAGAEVYYMTMEELAPWMEYVDQVYAEVDKTTTEKGKQLRDHIYEWQVSMGYRD